MGELVFDGDELSARFRDDGVLHVVADGVTEPEQVVFYGETMFPIYQARAPILHLLEIKNLQADNLAARWKMAEVLKRQRAFIAKSAVVGVARHLRFMAQVVVRVSGRKNVRFFDNTHEPTTWLLSP